MHCFATAVWLRNNTSAQSCEDRLLEPKLSTGAAASSVGLVGTGAAGFAGVTGD